MKVSPLKAIIILIVLAGVVYGTYTATMQQLPDLSGDIVGNTTSIANVTNQTIGTIYLDDHKNETSNISVIITKKTKLYKENKDNQRSKAYMKDLTTGSRVDVYTIGEYSNTIPPQITADEIIIKPKNK
ncbi:hypothetical protein [Methanosphaera cuniculi]|uniref:DUF5666 domain-containing protein n=1 Tax=Methanosphaera cuniculi TaxID=1077256 RepID=A0A2A2HG60_9EURY|nr:hypothetical protein [Methanosphaera cuniculi]PAV08264.1 hypothetical protein ASJ82_03480 [Methanosphaera cuniculi]PWL08354.1 hypothetical protein MSCUN_07900 [Methanosphaera cuniculi]